MLMQVVISVAFGLFLIGLGAYQIKVKHIVGKRGALESWPLPLVYAFSSLYVVAGLGALGVGANLALASQRLQFTCDQYDTGLCTEYRGDGWTAPPMCAGALKYEPCDVPNAMARCSIAPDAAQERMIYFFAHLREPQPTPEGLTPYCQAQGGTFMMGGR